MTTTEIALALCSECKLSGSAVVFVVVHTCHDHRKNISIMWWVQAFWQCWLTTTEKPSHYVVGTGFLAMLFNDHRKKHQHYVVVTGFLAVLWFLLWCILVTESPAAVSYTHLTLPTS